MTSAEDPNLWRSANKLPSAPGQYRVMLPSGKIIPATWLDGRWWERQQEIDPVAWRQMESSTPFDLRPDTARSSRASG